MVLKIIIQKVKIRKVIFEKSSSDNNGSEDDDSESSSSNNKDDFDEQSLLSRSVAKEKFIQILSDANDEEEMSIDLSLEELTLFDIYQLSDDNENMIIEEPEASEKPDDNTSQMILQIIQIIQMILGVNR
ncbi:hypothetical protein F8M41_005905 [Gigaspora margarita]|uniref:Uncharacterized protein n=1 Tax=Gigaspora margarita TaxID=4874 RepID=A0A8H4ERN3_GIGMA|nr:hypothetical protein F8M41_005905 [Gigaspora margarita]